MAKVLLIGFVHSVAHRYFVSWASSVENEPKNVRSKKRLLIVLGPELRQGMVARSEEGDRTKKAHISTSASKMSLGAI
jgi:hypothetical protein